MSSYDKEIQKAFDLAKGWAARDGIHPSIDEDGQEHYRIQQALKAACHGREDTAALVIIQQSVLRRLEQLRVLAIIGLLLLAYIAQRLS
ncbi:hypothetical protein PSE10B_32280 [Pseudomonas amygdali pv. eriobotryae]|jgi:hypothetical protein|uniref:hypothetical protein n=1 Tax=Pseudomonas amygdali TaxID=47877 RepID=UPI00167B90FA|nr:hypothetical protein [Pseudomonas amygdali]GFZ66706.1 hypothetical protein PSE10B_32280 [Pseudomonas amygdali pv. eriobotryae]